MRLPSTGLNLTGSWTRIIHAYTTTHNHLLATQGYRQGGLGTRAPRFKLIIYRNEKSRFQIFNAIHLLTSIKPADISKAKKDDEAQC